MWPNPEFPADLATFTKEILNGQLHFLRSGCFSTQTKFYTLLTSSESTMYHIRHYGRPPLSQISQSIFHFPSLSVTTKYFFLFSLSEHNITLVEVITWICKVWKKNRLWWGLRDLRQIILLILSKLKQIN